MATVSDKGADLLRVDGLVKAYGSGIDRVVAIEGMSFTVHSKEFVTVVGPSGCGKTTLLKCIAGLLTPTSGRIELNGRVVDRVPEELGLVFQEYSRSLFPWLTVAKNVAFPLRGSVGSGELEDRVADSLAAVGLEDVPDRYPWQLSGGMQQRVAIARALAYRPQVLLMDEPFGSVDAYTRTDLEDLILAVWRRYAMTILLVTHDIDESVYLGDRVLVLSRSPSQIIASIDVTLPPERDQVRTRQDPAFIDTRSKVAQGIFGEQQAGAKTNGSET